MSGKIYLALHVLTNRSARVAEAQARVLEHPGGRLDVSVTALWLRPTLGSLE
jgi:hypothetical protein